jgi:hypothetical protein
MRVLQVIGKARGSEELVAPAQAGAQFVAVLDSGVRRNDGSIPDLRLQKFA